MVLDLDLDMNAGAEKRNRHHRRTLRGTGVLYVMRAGIALTGDQGMPMDRAACIALAVHLGDDGAVERLVCEHQDQLYGYAMRLIGNSFDAEEVTQDAFIRACRTLMLRYGPDRCRRLNLRPWLFKITRNLALNRMRERRSKGEDRLSPVDERIVAPGTGNRETGQPLEAVVNRDTLSRALRRLEVESRDLVMLRFIEGLSYDEIAKVTGGSAASARGKVFRALRTLRAYLTEGGYPCVVKQ